MKIRKGSLSHFILENIHKASEDGMFEMFSYTSQVSYLRDLAGMSPSKKSYLPKYMRRLIDNGILEYEMEMEEKSAVRLTKLGKEFLGLEEAWDGKYRIVIWDIPENKRRLRDLLRRKLREWDFKRVQKSVWISKKNAASRLRRLILELGMEKWVIVIESDDKYLAHATRT